MIPNIGPRECRKRLATGAAAFCASVLIAAALFVAGVPRAWRLTLFLPLWVAGIGFFQARGRT